MLMPFRENPDVELTTAQADEEYPVCIARLKEFFQREVFSPIAHLLFEKIPDLLTFGDKYS